MYTFKINDKLLTGKINKKWRGSVEAWSEISYKEPWSLDSAEVFGEGLEATNFNDVKILETKSLAQNGWNVSREEDIN
jgi:hypothetical protein